MIRTLWLEYMIHTCAVDEACVIDWQINYTLISPNRLPKDYNEMWQITYASVKSLCDLDDRPR